MSVKVLQLKKIIRTLVIGVVFMLVGYLILSINTSMTVAKIDNSVNQMASLRNDLGELEEEYIDITSKISANLAYEMGFEDNLKDAVFVFRTKSVTALLSNYNEF